MLFSPPDWAEKSGRDFLRFAPKKEEIKVVLHYIYKKQPYIFEVRWTDPEGSSTIFRGIVSYLEKIHGPVFSAYQGQAQRLDLAVDQLYSQIYRFGEEYQAIPYDPKHRKRFLAAYGEIYSLSKTGEAGEEATVLTELFIQVLDKLQEMVEVYLLDNAYQGKYRYRRRNFEEWLETTPEGSISCEFESVLIQMTDLSRLLEQLSATQRERLVKHIFLNYTLQEIADQEGASRQSVSESIAAALKKLRTLL